MDGLGAGQGVIAYANGARYQGAVRAGAPEGDGVLLMPDGRTFETLDPATGNPITAVAQAGVEDVDRAVRAAREAFEPWANTTGGPLPRRKQSIRPSASAICSRSPSAFRSPLMCWRAGTDGVAHRLDSELIAFAQAYQNMT